MIQTYIGYHGTTVLRGENILSSKQYSISYKEEEWLGQGVYFFEKDIQQAVNFCVKARKYEDYIILKSKIEANICIDLDNLETMKILERISKEINKRYMKLKDGSPRKLKNAVILEKLYKIKQYDVVKKTFPVLKTTNINDTNFIWVQVQICVRNRECIKTIEEVIRNERSYIFN